MMCLSLADKISDPEHPKRKTSICLKIFLSLTTILGIVVLSVSVYYIFGSTGMGGFAAVTLVLGIGIIGFSIIGFFGSGYHYDKNSQKKLICLRIFWYAIFILAGILLLVGAVCALSSETIEYYVIMNLDDFQKDAKEKNLDIVASVVGNVVGVGVMALITGLILIIPFSLATHLMGARMFLETVGMFGCVIIAVLGVGAIVLAGYFYNYINIARQFSGLLIGVVVLGIFLIILGIIGFFGYWFERKYKWPIRLFAVLLIGVLLAFFVLGIVAFAQLDSLSDVVKKGVGATCGDDTKNWKEQIADSQCVGLVKNIVDYLCTNNKNKEGKLDPCPDKLKDESHCDCPIEVQNLTKPEFDEVAADFTASVLRGNYLVVGLLGLVIVVFLILMLVTVFATSCPCCYKRDKEIDKRNLAEGGVGIHGDLVQATRFGFMKWGNYELDRLMRFKNVLNNYHLDHAELFKYADKCMAAFRELGEKMNKKGGAEKAAAEIDRAMKSSNNKTHAAREVLDTCVNIYSQIATQKEDSIGFIYVEVNRLLREVGSLPDDSIDTLKKVVNDACGSLDSYVFLLWEGLKMMLSSPKEQDCVYRGMRIPTDAYEAYCKQVGKYIVMPAFSSFSVDRNVAYGFPGTQAQPDTVDVILKLYPYGRPLIEDVVYQGVKYEREVLIHPFSAFRVRSASKLAKLPKDERPVVELCDVEIPEKEVKGKEKGNGEGEGKE